MADSESLLVKDLRTRLAGDQAILVVGAGVSLASTGQRSEASWTGLLENGIRWCAKIVGNLPEGWKERMAAAIRSGRTIELELAAEAITGRLTNSKSR